MLTPLLSIWGFLIWSQNGCLSTKSSNTLVLVPNILKMFGLQAFMGTCSSDRQSVIGTKTWNEKLTIESINNFHPAALSMRNLRFSKSILPFHPFCLPGLYSQLPPNHIKVIIDIRFARHYICVMHDALIVLFNLFLPLRTKRFHCIPSTVTQHDTHFPVTLSLSLPTRYSFPSCSR